MIPDRPNVFAFCPHPPDWRLDWDGIVAAFPWVEAMRGVPQEPKYHAEGDVLTHVHLVCEALVSLPAWRGLDDADRAILFAAALFHDAGKPGRTVSEGGHVTSLGHSRLSASLARDYFWQAGADLKTRETTAALVRSHGLPLQFLDREDPDRLLTGFSFRGRCDHLALLAEADVLGRVCEDVPDLLARLELFREECKALGCWDQTYQFPSDLSRVQYFATPGRDRTYPAYDDTVCEVVLMSGLPASGKDTWITRNVPDLPVVSLDALREELGVSPKGDQAKVVAEARLRAKKLLRERRSFVWNATNVTLQIRRPLTEALTAQRARVRIVYLEAPWDETVRRNAARPSPVPLSVMENMRWRLEVPDLTEAQRVEWIETAES